MLADTTKEGEQKLNGGQKGYKDIKSENILLGWKKCK